MSCFGHKKLKGHRLDEVGRREAATVEKPSFPGHMVPYLQSQHQTPTLFHTPPTPGGPDLLITCSYSTCPFFAAFIIVVIL